VRMLVLALVATLLPAAAPAHFLQLVPDQDVLPDGGTVTFAIRFSHPMDGGPVMDLAQPARVTLVSAEGARDLLGDLVATPVDGKGAFSLAVDRTAPGGAYVVVEPQPYWEPAEGKFIVHHTKTFVDSFASGEGWAEPVGLPVEIRPLVRPTGLWTGNVFRGVVLHRGEPVPFAEIEVEYLNDGHVTAPNDAFVTQVILADAAGTFAYGLPRAGWWGFAALVEGPDRVTGPDGREAPVELGGLMWVRAVDMDD
jgi:cobalt/nickel transport protein